MAAADNRNRYLASDRIARESREWARMTATRMCAVLGDQQIQREEFSIRLG
jgi:hypothetical protein